jgi:hypothetical protein
MCGSIRKNRGSAIGVPSRSLIGFAWENMQRSTVQVNLGRTASGIVAGSCTDEVDRILEQIRRYRQWAIWPAILWAVCWRARGKNHD